MSYSTINRVVLIGRLTRDPELRALPSGSSVCSLRLACNHNWRDQEGDYQERPGYFDVSVFGTLGENVARYMSKGRQIAIDGRLDWREWETADQQRRQAVSVVADSVLFLDGPGPSPRDEPPFAAGSQGEHEQVDDEGGALSDSFQEPAVELVG